MHFTTTLFPFTLLLACSVVLVTAIPAPAPAPVPNPIPAPDMFADIMAAANAWTEQQRLAKDAELADGWFEYWALSDHYTYGLLHDWTYADPSGFNYILDYQHWIEDLSDNPLNIPSGPDKPNIDIYSGFYELEFDPCPLCNNEKRDLAAVGARDEKVDGSLEKRAIHNSGLGLITTVVRGQELQAEFPFLK
jgi:hypothetical protein